MKPFIAGIGESDLSYLHILYILIYCGPQVRPISKETISSIKSSVTHRKIEFERGGRD